MTSVPLRLDHVALPAFEAAATWRFYAETLQLPLLEAFNGDDWGGRAWLMMIFGLGDGRRLALTVLRGASRAADHLPSDLQHIALAVETPEGLVQWRARLQDAGIALTEEDHGAQQSIYFSDPNGNVLEITAPASATVASVDPVAAGVVGDWIGRQVNPQR